MKFSAVFRIALQSLQRHKMRSFLTMLGIVIGIAAVVASVSFGEGANQQVQAQIANMGTNLLFVTGGSSHLQGFHAGWGSHSTLTVEDANAILRECSAVKKISPGIDSHVQVVYGGQNWFTELDGIDIDYPEIRKWPMASGTFFSEEDVRRTSDVALVGQTLVHNLFGNEDPLGKSIRVAAKPFRVIGVLAQKGQASFGVDQDDRIEMPYTTAWKKIVGGSYLQFFAAEAVDVGAVDTAERQIRQLLRERHHIRTDEEEDFEVPP